jgi:hypothetical protein
MENLYKNNIEKVTQGDSRGEIISLIIFAILTGALWQFEIGRYILYPFTIMGTWFHEMSHGLAAILLGGNFIKLELFYDGSGIATHTSSNFLGGIGNAFIAAAGPLGPAVFGSLFIISTKNPKLTKFLLYFLSFLLILSLILWIRTTFGAIFALVFGIGIFFAAKKFNERGKRLLLQFFGVQSIMSVYLSIGYLFSSGASIEGGNYFSDTQVMQNELFLPYWFWGGLLLIISAILLFVSLKIVYQKAINENV